MSCHNAPQEASPVIADAFADALRHHQAGQLADAERLYRLILQRDSRHAESLHLLGLIAHQVGKSDVAVELISKAIGINGNAAAYRYNLGNALYGLGRLDDAVAAYGAALRIQPDLAEAYCNLGNALKDLGRLDEAVAACNSAVRIKPDMAEAHTNLGIALHKSGRLDDAVTAYGAALRIKPNLAEAHSNLGIALHKLGRRDDAVAAYNAALRIRPDYAEAHANLGNVLSDLGRLDEAVTAYNTALRLKPNAAEAHANLGKALKNLGRLDDAVAAYDTALRIKPEDAEAHANLGDVLSDLGRLNGAAAAYATALRLRPDDAKFHTNLGNVLRELGHLDDAAAAHNTALRIRPDDASFHTNLGNVLRDLGRLDDAVSAYNTALRIRPRYATAHSNLLSVLHYRAGVDKKTILATARRFAEQFEAKSPPSFACSADPDRRLRIGYVSGDFRRHAVGWMLSQVLAHHDHAAMEITCYSNYPSTDTMTARLRDAADHWRSLVGLSDQAAAALVAADGIDVLVDLSGHTAFNRLPMFARKPAPVQVTWLGFWGTTGLATMDYILSDAATIPPGEEDGYSERVVRLPVGRFCYEPPDYAPAPSPPPCLRGAGPTFGSFNNLAKVGPEVVQLWADVLHAVPGSRLLLKWRSMTDAGVRRRLTESFAAAGIDPQRLTLRGASGHAEMLAEYGDVDIALDPFPFCGGITSCEALWMGVPVVTLPGAAAPSRQTLGFLRVLGLTDWIAASPADYVRIAADLATDVPRLTNLRSGLRPRIKASALCDGARFTRDLERAYRDMWQAWCTARAADVS